MGGHDRLTDSAPGAGPSLSRATPRRHPARSTSAAPACSDRDGVPHTDFGQFLTLFEGRRFNPPVSLQPAGRAARHVVAEPNIWARLRLEILDVVPRWVELLGRYSKTPQPPKVSQIMRRALSCTHHPTRPRIHAVARRLSPDTIQQLVEDYRCGMPSTQLTIKYHLGKGTVLRLIRARGIQLRRQPMTDSEIHQAIKLYSQGLSLATVGERLGYDPTVIWHALTRAGVPRRDSHGREL